MVVGSADASCAEHELAEPYFSANELFNAGYIRDASVDHQAILKALASASGSHADGGMQRPSFDIQCHDGD